MNRKPLASMLVAVFAIALYVSACGSALKSDETSDSSYIVERFADEQIIRYHEILEEALKIPSRRWVEWLLTVEEMADDPDAEGWYTEVNGMKFTFGLPQDGAITDIEALFSAYSYLEEFHGVTKEHLSLFYPTFMFFVGDNDFGVWKIDFSPLSVFTDRYGMGYYSVCIDAKTGDFFALETEADALG